MPRLFFLIRSLEAGGAERQLIELARALDKQLFTVTVATFYDGGALRHSIEDADGVVVRSLGKRSRWDVASFLWRLYTEVRRARPDVLCGIMGLANELCLVLARFCGARAVWNLRASNVDLSHYGWVDGVLFRLGAMLSRFPDAVIVNSEAGRRHYIAHGYDGGRFVVIPNGINTERYRRDYRARARLRREWNVAADERLIGLIARLDPMKDHATFLQAAAILASQRPDVRFVCVGDGPMPYSTTLRALAASLGVGSQVRWIPRWSDMAALYSALDIATSSSAFGEGIQNSVCEAMACEVPCVVTEVGDLPAVVSDTGMAVPPRDPAALSKAWQGLLDLPEGDLVALGIRARERIATHYSMAQLVARTEAVLREVMNDCRRYERAP